MEYISIKEISIKWQMKERKVTALCRDNRIAGARKIGKNWLIPSDALKPIDKRTKEFENIQKISSDNVTYVNGDERVKSTFKNKYKKEPMYLTFTPYKISLLGDNTNHNLGKSIGFAIDKGIHMAYSVKLNGVIELEFLQFPKRAQWHILNTPGEKQNDWADNLREATIALSKRYALKYGLSGIIDSELPVSSLSSSNAIVITFLNALAFINNIKLEAKELIEIIKEIETPYDDLNPTCEIYAEKNKLLYMDMLDDSYKLINKPSNIPPFVIGIFSIGIENSHNNYHIRVDELRSTAYLLKAFSDMEYSTFNKTNLREVPYEIYAKYKDKLPNNFAKRADYFYKEIERVEEGVKAYQKGDISAFGKLVTESGDSFIANFGIDSLELTKLYEILKKNKGVYGVRISEADFKGCCIALINPKYADEIMQTFKDKYTSFICHTADGVKL